MQETAFLVVEMGGLQQTFIRYTAQHPGAVFDAALEPAAADGALQACGLLRGAPLGTLDALLAEAEEHYERVRTLERDDVAGTWLGLYRVPAASLTDQRVREGVGFLRRHGIGMCWVRIEEGVCYLRAQVGDAQQAHALAERCRGYLEGLGLDGEVGVESVSGSDLGLWRDLVTRAAQHS